MPLDLSKINQVHHEKPNFPDALQLSALVQGVTTADIIEYSLRALDKAGIAPVLGWACPDKDELDPKPEPMNALPAQLEKLRTLPPQFTELFLENKGKVLIFSKEDDGYWPIEIDLPIGLKEEPQLTSRLAALATLARQFLHQGRLRSLYIRRQCGSGECLPETPIAKTNRHIVLTTEEEVATEYDDPAAFWAAWDSREQVGEQILLFRAMAATDGASYLRSVLPAQAAMARAAKPKRTRYYAMRFFGGEYAIFNNGTPYLLPVGYDPQQRLMEFSCVLEPEEHIHAWEIVNCRRLVREKKLADGRPVDSVRVVFFEKAMALREKRPLLDVGVRVFFMKNDTDIEELTE